MAFTADEQTRIKYFLSYPDFLALAQSFQLGYPAASQPLFLVDDSFKRITPQGEFSVRRALCECESIEKQLSDARSRFKATKLGELHLNAVLWNEILLPGEKVPQQFFATGDEEEIPAMIQACCNHDHGGDTVEDTAQFKRPRTDAAYRSDPPGIGIPESEPRQDKRDKTDEQCTVLDPFAQGHAEIQPVCGMLAG